MCMPERACVRACERVCCFSARNVASVAINSRTEEETEPFFVNWWYTLFVTLNKSDLLSSARCGVFVRSGTYRNLSTSSEPLEHRHCAPAGALVYPSPSECFDLITALARRRRPSGALLKLKAGISPIEVKSAPRPICIKSAPTVGYDKQTERASLLRIESARISIARTDTAHDRETRVRQIRGARAKLTSSVSVCRGPSPYVECRDLQQLLVTVLRYYESCRSVQCWLVIECVPSGQRSTGFDPKHGRFDQRAVEAE
ncbi:hypothetical protein EVAR_14432_1 [Eumeta japonica]|uniref:Uncharacterized protein n=1 Tax=Eumeta variegata TaxID=151549 RepID=A0A4C1TXA0_EUMVA|nr:hypothetical protein EVAR_14432_1 [Eumeta japonica]